MEQHPVPQNISSFQFKLIGDITLKQFGYLAGGVIIAYIFTRVGFIPSLFRWPIAGISAFLGFGLAFLPIEERPMDRWLSAFIKSCYLPTQYIWQKQNQVPEVLLNFPAPAPVQINIAYKGVPEANRLAHKQFIASLPQTPKTQPKAPQIQPKSQPKPAPLPLKVATPPPPKVTPQPVPRPDWWTLGAPPAIDKIPVGPIPPVEKTSVTGKRLVFENERPATPSQAKINPKKKKKIKTQYQQQEQKLNQQIQSLQQELSQGALTRERLLEVQQILVQLMAERDKMSQELISLRQKLTQAPTATEKPTEYTKAAEELQTTVKMVTPNMAKQMGIPRLTSQPNVITGIIKDSRGALLPNFIVTVKDKDGVPVRALKTNKLGQFAASTPLSDGTYIIEVEDLKNVFKFNRIEVVLSGAVLPALEISAISERDIVRAQLAKELFGGNNI